MRGFRRRVRASLAGFCSRSQRNPPRYLQYSIPFGRLRAPQAFSRDPDDVGTPMPNAWFLPGFDFSTSRSSGSSEDLFKKAVEAFDAGRSDEAQGLLEKVIAESPGSELSRPRRAGISPLSTAVATTAVQPRSGQVPISDAPAWRWLKPSPRQAAGPYRGSDGHPRSRWRAYFPCGRGTVPARCGDRIFFSAGSVELGAWAAHGAAGAGPLHCRT